MKTRGFTLIELLVVISVIGLLSSIILANLNIAKEKARIAAGQEFAATLYHSLGAETVGRWTFDESSNLVVVDSSGNSNNGTMTSDLRSLDTYNNGGKSLGSSGAAVVRIPHNGSLSITDNLTLSLWMKLTDYGSYYAFYPLVKGPVGTPSSNYVVYVFGNYNNNGGQGNVGVYGARQTPLGNYVWSALSSTFSRLQPRRWYHVAFSYNSAIGGQLYIDGKLVGNRAGGGALATNTNEVNIGVRNSLVDDVIIFRQAMTTAQIQKLYAESAPKYLARK